MKGNKNLVTAIISILVVSLVALMVFIIIGISKFTELGNITSPPTQSNIVLPREIELNLDGVISDIKGNSLYIKSLNNNKVIKVNVVGTTIISDKYNKQIPLSQISVGEIVKLSYTVGSDDLKTLQIHPMSFTYKDLGIKQINIDNKSLTIGTIQYTLDELQVIENPNGNLLLDLDVINEFDDIMVKGLGNNIYSLKIVTGSGFIQLVDLPTDNGRLEINRQRQIPLSTLKNDIIEVQAGIYDIALYLDDYLPLILENVIIEYGQTYQLDAAGIQPLTYQININVINNHQPYELSINGENYGETREAYLQTGDYNLDISSEGFFDYSQSFRVKNNMTLQLILKEIPPPPPPKPEPEPEIILEPEPEFIPEPEIILEAEPEIFVPEIIVPKNPIINLNTSPAGAAVYIDGEYIGSTPVSKELNQGIYKIEFELNGYENYSTSIIVEEEDIQTDYLYVLIPK
ncbi:hypothetical protein AN641_08495 [Candidatus Epulonipiscioides gigas]|nr:hypothetical protein AN641_08495 [Epulopiscium sp. SCG-C07WGA-EpuloA2]